MNLQTCVNDQSGHGVGLCRGLLAHLVFPWRLGGPLKLTC
jgi:hypothetical protein